MPSMRRCSTSGPRRRRRLERAAAHGLPVARAAVSASKATVEASPSLAKARNAATRTRSSGLFAAATTAGCASASPRSANASSTKACPCGEKLGSESASARIMAAPGSSRIKRVAAACIAESWLLSTCTISGTDFSSRAASRPCRAATRTCLGSEEAYTSSYMAAASCFRPSLKRRSAQARNASCPVLWSRGSRLALSRASIAWSPPIGPSAAAAAFATPRSASSRSRAKTGTLAASRRAPSALASATRQEGVFARGSASRRAVRARGDGLFWSARLARSRIRRSWWSSNLARLPMASSRPMCSSCLMSQSCASFGTSGVSLATMAAHAASLSTWAPGRAARQQIC